MGLLWLVKVNHGPPGAAERSASSEISGRNSWQDREGRKGIDIWQGPQTVRNPPANEGDSGSIPKSGRFPGEEMASHSSTLTWRIPWTEKPGEL